MEFDGRDQPRVTTTGGDGEGSREDKNLGQW